MAKYGTFKYGSGTKYGNGAAALLPVSTGEVVWILNINWNGAVAVNEAGNLKGFSSFQGSEHYVDTGGSGFETMQPGRATLTMLNPDRRYDPNNASSPLYPYILPGRAVQVFVYILSTKVTKTVFTGFIVDIQPVSGKEEVEIIVEDGTRQLDTEVSMGMVSMGGIAEDIGYVLTAAGWKGEKFLETTNQPVQVFNPETGNALRIAQDLAAAALGVFFADNAGKLCFYPVSYNPPVTHWITQDQILKEIRLPRPWETVRNRIKIVANQRGRQPGSVIWALSRVEEFAAGETKTYGAIFDLADGIGQPKPYDDYVANTQSNNGGTDVTASFTVGFTEVSSSESNLSVTNGTAAKAYLFGLRLVGHKIVSSPQSFKSEDQSSIDIYQIRTFTLNNPWLQDRSFASTYAGWLKDFLKAPQDNAIIQIEQRPEIQFALGLMDHVNLLVNSRDISTTLNIRGMRHEWQGETGQSVLTTVYLQDVYYNATPITADPFIPDVPVIPEVPFPDTPPIDPYVPPVPPYYPPDPTYSCLMTDALPNGASGLTYTKMGLTNRVDNPNDMETFIWFPCTLRKAGALNPSYLIVNATWWAETPTLVFEMGNQWWHCDAISANKVVLASGAITNIDHYNRKVTFSPSAPVEVAGFHIWLETKANSFGLTTLKSSGTVAANLSGGVNLSLTVGNYYAVNSKGGPYDITNPSGACYAGNIKDSNGRVSGRIGRIRGAGYANELGTIGLKAETLDQNYGRVYFQALYSTIYRAYDYNDDGFYADNTGTIGFDLWNSSGPGAKTMSLIGGRIYNVCGMGIL